MFTFSFEIQDISWVWVMENAQCIARYIKLHGSFFVHIHMEYVYSMFSRKCNFHFAWRHVRDPGFYFLFFFFIQNLCRLHSINYNFFTYIASVLWKCFTLERPHKKKIRTLFSATIFDRTQTNWMCSHIVLFTTLLHSNKIRFYVFNKWKLMEMW